MKSMKALFFILTISLHLLCILALKLLDDIKIIIVIFFVSLILGVIIKLTEKNRKSLLSDIGWGLFYGSITSSVLVITFLFWLAYALSR